MALPLWDIKQLYFTFWGLNVLRKEGPVVVKKNFFRKMFGFMMPRGVNKLNIKMNMGGIGTQMMKHIMKEKNVNDFARTYKAHSRFRCAIGCLFYVYGCDGNQKERLIDGVIIGGVGYYLGEAGNANVNLFI